MRKLLKADDRKAVVRIVNKGRVILSRPPG